MPVEGVVRRGVGGSLRELADGLSKTFLPWFAALDKSKARETPVAAELGRSLRTTCASGVTATDGVRFGLLAVAAEATASRSADRVRATLEGVACFFDRGASLAGVSVGWGRLLDDLELDPGGMTAVDIGPYRAMGGEKTFFILFHNINCI